MQFARQRFLFALGLVSLVVAGVLFSKVRRVPREYIVAALPDSPVKDALEEKQEEQIRRVEVKNPTARKIVNAARTQVGDAYDASYRVISFPGGDVPKGSGACTDVVVRAFRGAGIDLQELIHDDMKANFGVYPKLWRLTRTDKNIDHRRVPNHITFFGRFGQSLPLGTSGVALKTWQPGDVVEWKLDDGRWHTGVISDGVGPRGLPLVVHNGWQCVEQDALDAWKILGHFRYPRRAG